MLIHVCVHIYTGGEGGGRQRTPTWWLDSALQASFQTPGNPKLPQPLWLHLCRYIHTYMYMYIYVLMCIYNSFLVPSSTHLILAGRGAATPPWPHSASSPPPRAPGPGHCLVHPNPETLHPKPYNLIPNAITYNLILNIIPFNLILKTRIFQITKQPK